MPIPYRMNTVPVEVTVLISDTDLEDTDYRAPTPKQYSETILYLSGLVFYNSAEDQKPSGTGDVDDTLGRVTFKKSYLDGLGIELKKGDLFTKIAGRVVSYKITEVRPTGHLNGIQNLIRCVFEENEYKRKSV